MSLTFYSRVYLTLLQLDCNLILIHQDHFFKLVIRRVVQTKVAKKFITLTKYFRYFWSSEHLAKSKEHNITANVSQMIKEFNSLKNESEEKSEMIAMQMESSKN